MRSAAVLASTTSTISVSSKASRTSNWRRSTNWPELSELQLRNCSSSTASVPRKGRRGLRSRRNLWSNSAAPRFSIPIGVESRFIWDVSERNRLLQLWRRSSYLNGTCYHALGYRSLNQRFEFLLLVVNELSSKVFGHCDAGCL